MNQRTKLRFEERKRRDDNEKEKKAFVKIDGPWDCISDDDDDDDDNGDDDNDAYDDDDDDEDDEDDRRHCQTKERASAKKSST